MDTMIPPMQDAVQPSVCPECECGTDRHAPSYPFCPTKRLVLISTEGDHAGLHQIFGHLAVADVSRLQTFIPEILFSDGRTSGASLIRVDQRAVYYRELILPTSVKDRLATDGSKATFHPGQE